MNDYSLIAKAIATAHKKLAREIEDEWAVGWGFEAIVSELSKAFAAGDTLFDESEFRKMCGVHKCT